MKRDLFLKGMLLLIAVFLLLNLLSDRINVFTAQKAAAVASQKMAFRGNGVGIACSSDGKYVYAAGSGAVLRSSDFGAAGSWELVVEN